MSAIEIIGDGSTRDRIAESAAALFADRGFAGVSMRDIADAVGIKAASLYNHFADKEELYQEALARGFADRLALMESALAITGTAEQRLRAAVRALADGNAYDSNSNKLLLRELLDGDATRLKRLSKRMFAGPYQQMVELFEELCPDVNSSFAAACLSAMLVGYYSLNPVLAFLSDSLPFDPEEVSTRMADLMLASRAGDGK